MSIDIDLDEAVVDRTNKYKTIKKQAKSFEDQIYSWQQMFDEFRATLDSANQAKLDNKRDVFINNIKTTLSIP